MTRTGPRAGWLPRGRHLALLLMFGAAPLALFGLPAARHAPPEPDRTLGAVAREAGCRLTEFASARANNPPVGGRVNEREVTSDGSYVGRQAPSSRAALHSLMHGRVLVQYRPDLPPAEVGRLDDFARADSARVVVFENSTRMRPPVAATAYLTLMTCEGVDRRTLVALRAFRDRRRAFGQSF